MTNNPLVYVVMEYNYFPEDETYYPFLGLDDALNFVFDKVEDVSDEQPKFEFWEGFKSFHRKENFDNDQYHIALFDGKTGTYIDKVASNFYINHPRFKPEYLERKTYEN